MVTLIAGTLLSSKPEMATRTDLHRFLEDSGSRLFVAWLITSLSALAWVVFVVGLRSILSTGPGMELFAVAAVLGQGLIWTGASLDISSAAPDARDVPFVVYNAISEAAHLTTSAGFAATGLALIGLSASTAANCWSRRFSRMTMVAGIILIIACVVGPIIFPVLVLWLAAISALLLRAHLPAEPVGTADATSQ